MPTENRSSNTEMVSVPREWLNSVALLQMPLDELQEQAIQHLCEPCDEPAPQAHPEPIAWMVGTAIWWTKEEAERDAAATGLPIVGLGPMADTAPAEQHHGKPVAWRGINELGEVVTEWIDGVPPSSMVDLCGNPASFASIEQAYTHADPGEVERLCEVIKHSDAQIMRQSMRISNQRAQLAERDALLKQAQWYLSNALPFYHGAASGEVISDANRVCHEIRTLLSASAEPSAPTWSCQACQVEQPNDRACDACGGQTALIAAKS